MEDDPLVQQVVVPALQAAGFEIVPAASVRRGGVTQENRREGTVGRALPGTAVRVVRPDGALADPDEVGRIGVRGPGRMLGYLGEGPPPPPGDPAGWIDTGDLGTLDRDGFLRVTGRA